MSLSLKKLFLILVASIVYQNIIVAQTNLDSLESLANRTSGEEKLTLLLDLCEEYIIASPDKALDIGLQVLIQSKNQVKPIYEARALWIMGRANFKLANYENALRYYNRALGEFEKLNMREEQARILLGLAEVYDSEKYPEMALLFLERAHSISIQIKNYQLQIDLLMNLGKIHAKKGNYKNALNQYQKILQLLGNDNISTQQKNIKVACFNKMGQSYVNLGEFNESIDAYKHASQLSKFLGDSLELEKTFRSLGLSFYLLQKMDSSLVYYTKAYKLSNSIPDSTELMLAIQGIGDVHFESGNFTQALNYFNRQLSIAERIKDNQGIVTSLVKISRCYYVSGDYPTSTRYLNRALVIAKKENLYSTAADVYQYLSLISESEGKYRDALAFYKLWAEIRDSIYNEESGEKLAKLQILYDISQKERENEILRQSSEIQNLQLSKSRYQRIILIAVAISFFVLIIFLILLYQSKHKEVQKQKEAEQRIVEINKELERRMILEIKKQEKQQHLLAQKSKLESLGTLAAGIAHEINQPLGGISMGLDNILLKANDNNCSESYLKDKIKSLFNNVDRIKRIIDHIRMFSRAQKPLAFEAVDVNDVINNALLMVQTQYQTHNIQIEVDLANTPCRVTGDKFKLEQVVLNLLSNAKYAVDEKERRTNSDSYMKQIQIKSWIKDQYVGFNVRDNGIGIKPDNIEKIYDPFFTTKSEDKGTGLGLSIAYGFIKDILGDIKVDSQEGEYTLFEITIPKS